MTDVARRTAVLALAVAGLAPAALAALEQPTSLSLLSIYLWSLPVGAALLGAWLAVRTAMDEPLASLSVGLSAIPAVVAAWMLSDAAEATWGQVPYALMLGLGTALLGLGGFAWLRFHVLFPIPLLREDVLAASGSGALVGLPGLRNVSLGKSAASIARLVELAQARSAWAWVGSLSLALGAVATVAELVLPSRGFAFFVATPLASTLLVGTILAVLLPVLTLHRCNEEARRRLLWLMAGLVAALYTFLLYGALLVVYVLAAWFGVDLPILAAAAFVMMPLPFLIFLVALWLGALFGGTLDPRVALKGTLIVGTLSAGGLFVFAVLEAAIADSALTRLGFSQGLGAWIAAGSAAVAFRPVQRRIETRVEMWLEAPQLTPDRSGGAL